MDLDAVFKLMDRAEKSSFNRIEIQYQDLKLSLERGNGQLHVSPPPAAVVNAESAPAEADDKNLIRSPISGVFYSAKEPGARPFVETGKLVNKGETVCIIEAMKTMNEISAPLAGVIISVLAKDGQTVAAGEALFRVSGDK